MYNSNNLGYFVFLPPTADVLCVCSPVRILGSKWRSKKTNLGELSTRVWGDEMSGAGGGGGGGA